MDHVRVRIVRELHVQAVAGLARFPVADVVGKNDEVLRCVEKLARSEQQTTEGLREETSPTAAGAVHDNDRIGDLALRVLHGRSDGRIVKSQFRQSLAGGELKVLGDE